MEVLLRIESLQLNEGRSTPIPAISVRKLEKMEREAALARAMDEQQREEAALVKLDLKEAAVTADAATKQPQNGEAAQQEKQTEPEHPSMP